MDPKPAARISFLILNHICDDLGNNKHRIYSTVCIYTCVYIYIFIYLFVCVVYDNYRKYPYIYIDIFIYIDLFTYFLYREPMFGIPSECSL